MSHKFIASTASIWNSRNYKNSTSTFVRNAQLCHYTGTNSIKLYSLGWQPKTILRGQTDPLHAATVLLWHCLTGPFITLTNTWDYKNLQLNLNCKKRTVKISNKLLYMNERKENTENTDDFNALNSLVLLCLNVSVTFLPWIIEEWHWKKKNKKQKKNKRNKIKFHF